MERAARTGAGLNPVPEDWESFAQTLTRFRRAAQAAQHDLAGLPIVVRTNTTIAERPASDRRPPLTGSHEQVANDLRRLRDLGVDEVFFDMNRFAIPPHEQFRILDRLRAALA